MGHVQKISVDLTPALNAAVQDAVTSGEYVSASAVIQEALQYWTEKKSLRNFSGEELRKLWDEGKASGTPQKFVIEEIILKAKDRLERSRVNPA